MADEKGNTRTQPAPSSVPAGYVLVPREPTDAMMEAGIDHILGGSSFDQDERRDMVRAIWPDMLAAAPPSVEAGRAPLRCGMMSVRRLPRLLPIWTAFV